MRVAVVDDDPVEHVILSEMSQSLDLNVHMEGFARLDAFLDSEPSSFDIVFLDRRIPPHDSYSETLPQLQESGYSGHVVLMSAHVDEPRVDQFAFRVTGPVDKIDLMRSDRLKRILTAGAD
ncbi:response regulator [uncultured Maricaulis sp.]|jgi:FixJ family two-component response regulator|uniref:response regulator n=1 Tax=uncultured Maricaulis sp. TaxID=174710 RepID=UPI0025E1C0CD|nr:response regulator [uncultured Maricaulis sp.]